MTFGIVVFVPPLYLVLLAPILLLSNVGVAATIVGITSILPAAFWGVALRCEDGNPPGQIVASGLIFAGPMMVMMFALAERGASGVPPVVAMVVSCTIVVPVVWKQESAREGLLEILQFTGSVVLPVLWRGLRWFGRTAVDLAVLIVGIPLLLTEALIRNIQQRQAVQRQFGKESAAPRATERNVLREILDEETRQARALLTQVQARKTEGFLVDDMERELLDYLQTLKEQERGRGSSQL